MTGAQSNIFIEGGPGFSVPLQKESGSPSSSGNLYGSYDKTSTGAGFYLRSGINLQVFKKNNFQISVPLGVSYFSYSQKYFSENYGSGQISSYDLIWKNTVKAQYIGCFLGPQLAFSKNKLSVYGNFLINAEMLYLSKDYYSDNRGMNYMFTQTTADEMLFIISSVGLGASYRINDFSLGLNADVYFFARGAQYSSFTKRFYYNSLASQVWINPGIRIQYHFK